MTHHAQQPKPIESSIKLPVGMQLYSAKDEMDAERIQILEEMAFRHARYYDSYLITEPDREYLWSSEDYGVLGFSRRGRYLNVAGGLICGEYQRAAFLEEIVEFLRLNQFVISFFSIDESDAELFRSFGFQVSRFGVESRINLEDHAWRGKPYEWVRRQSNFVARQSVSFEEWSAEAVSSEVWDQQLNELKAVSEEHIAGKAQKGEIPFFEGRLIPGHLHRRRIFVARSDNGRSRVEGFAICNPMMGGDSWSIEMYRQRTDAPRGTIPFLIKQVIDVLQAEGCRQVSICPVPTIGTDRQLPGSSLPARIGMSFWNKLGPLFYDCQGLIHFKSRFRPTFSDVYICAYPSSSWGAVWAYMMTIGAFDLKWSAVLKRLFSFHLFRRKLATPNIEPVDTTSQKSKSRDEQVLYFSQTDTGSPASQDTEEPADLKQVS